tara:strand:+ start:345 stop:527 length:183 start_codon:yes stop_codon:yes gene_type:complete
MLEAIFWDECGTIAVIEYNPDVTEIGDLIDQYPDWRYRYSCEPYVPSEPDYYDPHEGDYY